MVFQTDFEFIESLRHCSANQQMIQLTTLNSLSKSDQYCTGRSRFQQVKLVIVKFKRYRSQHTLSLRGYSVIGLAFAVRLRNCRFLFSKSLLVRRKAPTSNFPQTQTLSKGQVICILNTERTVRTPLLHLLNHQFRRYLFRSTFPLFWNKTNQWRKL